MTKDNNCKVWFDTYKKILHIGKIMICLQSNWKLGYYRVDASKAHYFRIGRVAIRL